MKKIININLSGRVVPIEDAAYESLKNYIESLRRYFAHEEGRDEIINDIESRIAELMSDKIRKGQSAITEADIDEIIGSMGRVEDFEAADAADNTAAASGEAGTGSSAEEGNFRFSFKTSKGRLYRDSSDKFLGGVCSGIANYVNMDPAVVRLLFAIITFGGFGFGVLIYLLLWIILPSKNMDTYTGKRLFRNPDDRVIGGVAGGLAAYFNKEAWIIRLIFVAPLLLNILLSIINGIFNSYHFGYGPDIFFGSFTGTFFLAYIILWILLPEAKSPFEKMEMRGETVDVNRIRQNVKEGMDGFKTRMQSWGEEVKASAQDISDKAKGFANTRGKDFAAEVSRTAQPVATGIGHAIGVIIKAFFIFVAGSIAFALFVAFIVLIFGGSTAFWPLKSSAINFVLNGFWQQTFFWATVIFFFLVPIIAFITWLVRRLMKVRSQKHYLGWIFSALWTIGWVSLILLVSSVAREFRYSREATEQIALQQPQDNRLMVMVSEPEIRYNGDMWFINDENTGWDLTTDSLKMANIKIRVIKSLDSSYSVNLIRQSRGRTGAEATARAERIVYNLAQSNNILQLGSGLAIGRNDKFRAQDVEVEIRVPVGRKIHFDASVSEKLHPVNVKVIERRRRNRNRDYDIRIETDRRSFMYKTNIDYVMTVSGELLPADQYLPGPLTPAPGSSNEDSLNRVIREKERELELLRQQKSGQIIIRRNTGKSVTAREFDRPFFTVLI